MQTPDEITTRQEAGEKPFDIPDEIKGCVKNNMDCQCPKCTEYLKMTNSSSSNLALLEKVEGEVDSLVKDVRPEITEWLTGNRETNESFNSALDQVKEIIKKLKNN